MGFGHVESPPGCFFCIKCNIAKKDCREPGQGRVRVRFLHRVGSLSDRKGRSLGDCVATTLADCTRRHILAVIYHVSCPRGVLYGSKGGWTAYGNKLSDVVLARPRRSKYHPNPAVTTVAPAPKRFVGTPAIRGSRWPGSSRAVPGTRVAGKNEPQ